MTHTDTDKRISHTYVIPSDHNSVVFVYLFPLRVDPPFHGLPCAREPQQRFGWRWDVNHRHWEPRPSLTASLNNRFGITNILSSNQLWIESHKHNQGTNKKRSQETPQTTELPSVWIVILSLSVYPIQATVDDHD